VKVPALRQAYEAGMARSPFIRQDAAVALIGLALLAAWDASGWDLSWARRYGSAAGFALRDAWMTGTLLHEGGRNLAWAAFALLATGAMRSGVAGPSRRERLYWLGVTLAALLLVLGLRRLSHTSCPWDLTEFGGTAAYVPPWVWGVRDGGPGHCFPSAHAVSAFAFLSQYFLWREHRPRRARRVLGAVLGVGLLVGWTQLVRGAHFPSHMLWSAWLCWTVCAVAARWRRPALGRLSR
jgi:membrane-associated PAP2 superfamily phosphatase